MSGDTLPRTLVSCYSCYSGLLCSRRRQEGPTWQEGHSFPHPSSLLVSACSLVGTISSLFPQQTLLESHCELDLGWSFRSGRPVTSWPPSHSSPSPAAPFFLLGLSDLPQLSLCALWRPCVQRTLTSVSFTAASQAPALPWPLSSPPLCLPWTPQPLSGFSPQPPLRPSSL